MIGEGAFLRQQEWISHAKHTTTEEKTTFFINLKPNLIHNWRSKAHKHLRQFQFPCLPYTAHTHGAHTHTLSQIQIQIPQS